MFQTTNQESHGSVCLLLVWSDCLFHYHRQSFVTLWQFNLWATWNLTLWVIRLGASPFRKAFDYFRHPFWICHSPGIWWNWCFQWFNDTNSPCIESRSLLNKAPGQDESRVKSWSIGIYLLSVFHTHAVKGSFLGMIPNSRPQERMSQSGDGLSQRSLSNHAADLYPTHHFF